MTSDKFPQLNGTILLHQNIGSSMSTASLSSGGSNGNLSGLGMGSISNNNSTVISESNVAPVIEMHWKVPMSSVSGLAVASLQMTNERYKPYKGVRTVAKSGKFLIRSV